MWNSGGWMLNVVILLFGGTFVNLKVYYSRELVKRLEMVGIPKFQPWIPTLEDGSKDLSLYVKELIYIF